MKKKKTSSTYIRMEFFILILLKIRDELVGIFWKVIVILIHNRGVYHGDFAGKSADLSVAISRKALKDVPRHKGEPLVRLNTCQGCPVDIF